MKILLIDTMSLLYRSYFAIQNLYTKDGKPTGALLGLTRTIFKLIKEIKPTHVIACYDRPEKTKREEIFEDYKANRSAPEDDLIEQIVSSKEILEDLGISVLEKPKAEADDLIGTLSKRYKDKKIQAHIITCDNDILQLVEDGVFVHMFSRSDLVKYDSSKVKEKFGFEPKLIPDYKGLLGDPSDNIPGVYGIGEKTAKRLIQDFGDLDLIYKAVKDDKTNETDRVINLLKKGEKQGRLSKEIATIHTDENIPEKFIEQEEWKKRVNIKKSEEVLYKYELLSSLKTLKGILGNSVGSESQSVDSSKLKKALIALWILDSDKTNADLDDVFIKTKERDIDKSLKILERELEKEELIDVWKKIEEPLIDVVSSVEKNGVHVDIDKLKKLDSEISSKILKLEREIYKIAGKEFNINSPKQLGEILFDELKLIPKGTKRSTKESVLNSLEHKIIPLIKDHRHLRKLKTTYIDVIPKHIDKNNRLHTTLSQNGTTTGRFSSKDPNLQNIPITGEYGKEMRNLFTAEKGWKLLSADYSQMELRIAAILSKDQNLIKIFQEEKDIHKSVAQKIFNVEDVTKEMRNSAKAINFGIIYGIGATNLKYSLGDVTVKEAKEFLDRYKKLFSSMTSYLERLKVIALEHGYVETAFKRRRYIKDINSSLNFVRSQAERLAMNSPIQGTGADIIKLAMINIDKKIKEKGLDGSVRMILQIHDELLFEIKEDKLDEIKNMLKEEMESIYPLNKKPIIMKVDMSFGDSWGDLSII